MLDIKLLRENPDLIKKAVIDKNGDPSIVDRILKVDETKGQLLIEVEKFRALRNRLGKDDLQEAIKVKEMLRRIEPDLSGVEEELKNLLWQLPNPALSDTPVGKDESGNIELRKQGKIPEFDFPIKSHDQLGIDLDIIDTERASKVSGTRFGYLKGDGVMLEMALLDLGFKLLIKEGFTPIFPPVMIKKEVMMALGYNNKGFEETYVLPDDDLCLIATAEHAIVPYFKDETLNNNDLPKRFVGYSSAFRRESGSYGKDTKGILRVHQFNKLEMVSFVKPEDSEKEHEFLLSLEEDLMGVLELPYRVLKMCTGDLGDPAAAKYDIEAWFPSENKYRETHSCSNCTDYQSRRLNIKYRTTNNQQQTTEYVHILNGTAFSERPILAILENYQQEDGSVVIPKVLRNYIGKDKISP
jgi:seryl-tRNA synthetase